MAYIKQIKSTDNVTYDMASFWLYPKSTLTLGASGLQYFNQTVGVTSGATTNANPVANQWFHIIRMNHADRAGYYTDLAFDFHANDIYIRTINNGTEIAWDKIAKINDIPSIGNGPICVLNIGTTSNGLGLTYNCMSNTKITDNDYYNPNFYFGKVILSDSSTSKGCIYVADDNSYIVATDEGISAESTFTSIIDSTRKGFLVPVTDSTHGAIFKDIYMMACAPVQYNKFKFADTGNKYLAGKAICLAD